MDLYEYAKLLSQTCAESIKRDVHDLVESLRIGKRAGTSILLNHEISASPDRSSFAGRLAYAKKPGAVSIVEITDMRTAKAAFVGCAFLFTLPTTFLRGAESITDVKI